MEFWNMYKECIYLIVQFEKYFFLKGNFVQYQGYKYNKLWFLSFKQVLVN